MEEKMKEGHVKIKRALASVWDKTHLPEFTRQLISMDVEMISSTGTATRLEENKIHIRHVEELTGFPDMLGHRVMTLHPMIHGGILAERDNPKHQADIKKYGLELIDLVINTLYPFEEVIAKPDCTPEKAIEMIDIGGVALLRGAAKNYKDVVVVSNISQYEDIIAEMRVNDGCISKETRLKLAVEAFSVTATYDAAIHKYLDKLQGTHYKHE